MTGTSGSISGNPKVVFIGEVTQIAGVASVVGGVCITGRRQRR